MLIDLHTHTHPASWDANLSPDELVKLSKAAELDGVCLAEHDYFWNPAEVEALARRHDFLVLPAVELNTEIGHVLVYGLDKYEWGMDRMVNLAPMVEAAGAVMIASHPYRRYMRSQSMEDGEFEQAIQRAASNASYRKCVALEKIHGRASQQQNLFAERLCQMLGIPGTAGSDAHRPSHVGRCATRFERDISSIRELIEELRAGRFEAVDLRAAQAE